MASYTNNMASTGCPRHTAPEGTPCGNYAFDVTPAELVTGLITERGICEASPEGLKRLFPEQCG